MTFTPALQQQLSTRLHTANMRSGYADLDAVITASGLQHPDHMGWLIDQSTQRRVWAVLADLLLCVFDSPKDDKPSLVQLMPGLQVKGVVYNSVRRDILSHLADDEPIQSRSLSGVCRYQVILDNPCQQKVKVYGVDTKLEMETWLSFLKVATTLDIDLFGDSDLSLDLDTAGLDPRTLVTVDCDGDSEDGLKVRESTVVNNPGKGCHGIRGLHILSSSSASSWLVEDGVSKVVAEDSALATDSEQKLSELENKAKAAPEVQTNSTDATNRITQVGQGMSQDASVVAENNLNMPDIPVSMPHSPRILSPSKSSPNKAHTCSQSRLRYERSISHDSGVWTLPSRPRLQGLLLPQPHHKGVSESRKRPPAAEQSPTKELSDPVPRMEIEQTSSSKQVLKDNFIAAVGEERGGALQKASVARWHSCRDVSTKGQVQNGDPSPNRRSRRLGSFDGMIQKLKTKNQVKAFTEQNITKVKPPHSGHTEVKPQHSGHTEVKPPHSGRTVRRTQSIPSSLDKDKGSQGSNEVGKSGLKSSLSRKASPAKVNRRKFGSIKKKERNEDSQLWQPGRARGGWVSAV